MKKVTLLFLTAMLVVSCVKDIGVTQDTNESSVQLSYKVSEEEAIDVILEFLDEYHQAIDTKGGDPFIEKRVSDVQVIRSQNVETRSTIEDSHELVFDIDTLMYAINFANNQGFALLSADRRTEPILAIIEEGNFNVTELQAGKDDGFLLFLERALLMEHDDIENYDESIETKSLVTNGYTINSQYGPLLHAKWAQDQIYGSYCPNGIGGCVIIATAQILSYYQTPGQVSWSYNNTGGSATLNWSQIIADCDNHDGKLTSSDCATSRDAIAHLVRYLGIAMGAEYNSSTTSAKSKEAISWFNDWSVLSATSLKDYSQTKIVDAIKNGYPVYARGYAGRTRILGITISYSNGHAWVYDGVISATKDGSASEFIHCNWGWGGYKNGYYSGKAFDTTGSATLYDSNDTQNGSEYNFQYKLQYSIVTK